MQNARKPSRQPMINFAQKKACTEYSDEAQVAVLYVHH